MKSDVEVEKKTIEFMYYICCQMEIELERENIYACDGWQQQQQQQKESTGRSVGPIDFRFALP